MGFHPFQALRHLLQSVVDAGQVAVNIVAQLYLMGHFPFQRQRGFLKKLEMGDRQGKAPVTANLLFFSYLQLFAGGKESFPGRTQGDYR